MAYRWSILCSTGAFAPAGSDWHRTLQYGPVLDAECLELWGSTGPGRHLGPSRSKRLLDALIKSSPGVRSWLRGTYWQCG
jgi:hypothetical protein